jgi:serine phosphatase RsbU (regulator of sigma subunit)
MNFQLLVGGIYLACGIILFFLGVIILRENAQNRINRVTSLMLFFAGLGPLFGALGTILKSVGYSSILENSIFYQNIFYFWELFFPQLLLFSLLFPEEHPFIKKFSRLKYIIFIPHIFHCFLVLIFYDPSKIINFLDVEKMGSVAKIILDPISYILRWFALLLEIMYKVHVQFFSIINLIYLMLAIWFLYQGAKKVQMPRLKRQVNLILWGIRSSMGLYVVAFILPVITPLRIPDALRYALTIIALVMGSGVVAWAIIRHHFLDVRLIIRQSLVYSLTTLLLVGAYFLVVVEFGRWVQRVIGMQIPLLDVGYVILAIMLFQPVMGQVDDMVKRVLIRDKSDYRNMMETFSREIVTLFDLEKLSQKVMSTLRNEMMVEQVFLSVYDRERKGYRLFSLADQEGVIDLFSPEDIFFKILGGRDRPSLLEDLNPHKVKSVLYPTLLNLKVYLVVPLKEKENLVGFIALSKKFTGFRYTYEDITLLTILANQLVIAINNARLYAESLEKQRLEEELAVARQIQLDLLPRAFPQSSFFEISAYTSPARQVGGDYYDFLKKDDGTLAIALADASGKGIPAALLVSLVHASLRAEIKDNLPVWKTVSNINNLINSSTSAEKFVTMFYGELDPQARRLTYCNAGHNYPILVRKGSQVQYLDVGGLILGAFAGASYQMGDAELSNRDLIFFYSDGLTDSRNLRDEEFGEKRLIQLLLEWSYLSTDELKEKIVNEVNIFSQGTVQYDDLTFVALKVLEK